MLNNNDYLHIFHEIKNSITLINSCLQLVAKKHPEVCCFDYWTETMSEIDSLKNIVTQLSFVRSCGYLNFKLVNIYSFMEQIAASIAALCPGSFLCKLDIEKNLPLIEMDSQLLKQAIINLTKNAYEAMNHSGIVNIRVFVCGDLLNIAIIDHGGGLDPTLADRVFQPFITSKSNGSGLGLTITAQIIESHQGSLSYDSRPGDGCTFTLSLPFKQN